MSETLGWSPSTAKKKKKKEVIKILEDNPNFFE
jgi:hypothetical protein